MIGAVTKFGKIKLKLEIIRYFPILQYFYVCFIIFHDFILLDLSQNALVCGVQLWVCHFCIGILGQVWYLIVSIPGLCTLTYFTYVSAVV